MIRSSVAAAAGIREFIRKSIIEVLIWVALLTTAAALYLKDDLLTESLTFRADNASHSLIGAHYHYSDQPTGGMSTIAPVPNEPLAWSCQITKAVEYPFCGFGFNLSSALARGLDLSDYQTVKLELDYKGPGRLMRVYLKNNNPAYSQPGNPERDKYNYIDVATTAGTHTYELPISRFAVADWWKALEKIPPRLAYPEFTNVVGIEAQLGQDAREGSYEVRIRELAFERRLLSDEQFYSTLAFIWVLLITAMLWHKRRQARAREQDEAERLRWASDHDPLTLLPNRRAFQHRLQTSILGAMERGSSTALLLLDLDYFKHVNDSLGHSAGDDLLKCVAERLSNSIDKDSFVARIGGDEFAIIIEDVKSGEDVTAIGNRALQRLKEPMQLLGREVVAGGSIGAAIFPAHGACAGELINAADTALYALKGSGRGGTKLLDQHVLDSARRSASHLNIARSAAEDKRIIPFYQPVVQLSTGKIVGFEALLRCEHASSLHPASVLEEAFADYEVATRISELMHNQVASDVAGWIRDGLDIRRVAINAAPSEFLRDDYAERLLNVLSAHNLAPQYIAVEVTEHVFLGRSSEYVARAVQLLKKAGVRIYLDDFGTGYSSLSHLLELEVDAVKLDRSFIEKLADGGATVSIVAAVVSLAKSLNISTVAEGVETDLQADLLRSMHCDHAQGYHFGRPRKAEELMQSLTHEVAA